MPRKTIKIFINEIDSKPSKKNHSSSKTDVYHIDDIWSLVFLDINDYAPERRHRYNLVVIDKF